MSSDCIFCKIIAKEIPATVIAETDDILVIQDRAPKAPVHYLIMPKQHVDGVNTLEDSDAHLVGKMALIARQLGTQLTGSGSFRLIVNNGADAGQSVFHLHMHFVSGKKMLDF